jgi:hypothetical protein
MPLRSAKPVPVRAAAIKSDATNDIQGVYVSKLPARKFTLLVWTSQN